MNIDEFVNVKVGDPPTGAIGVTGVLHVDFETRSYSDLKRVGAHKYSAHPTTQVLCMAARLGDQSIEALFPDAPNYPIPEAIRTLLPTLTVAAHNAAFEMAIWRNVLHWPEPAGWYCTMALASTRSLPQGLDAISRYLGTGEKDAAGYRLMMKLSKPDRTGSLPYASADQLAKLLAYCKQDVALEVRLAETYGHSLPANENAVWRMHAAINDRGIYIDRDLCERAIRMVGQVAVAAGVKVERATEGAIKRTDLSRVAFLLAWLHGQGVHLDDLSAGSVEVALADQTLPPIPRAVLSARLAISRSSTAKLEAMLDAAGEDGRVRGCFNYHKAHTGRWGGRLFQPQNLPKPAPGVDVEGCIAAVLAEDLPALVKAGGGSAQDGLVAVVRPAVCAAPGKTLLIADYNAIEARGVDWLAGDLAKLEAWRAGVDMYCHTASRIYGRPITKTDKLARGIGKVAKLGCGYGMGAKKFGDFCAAQGIDLSAAGVTPETIIAAYRSDNSMVCAKRTGLWAQLDYAALQTVKTGSGHQAGPHLRFRMGTGALYLDLPGGRCITYHSPRVERELAKWSGGDFMADKLRYSDIGVQGVIVSAIWGGTFLENACQAICRDLLADAMLRAEAENLPTVLHCHDEDVPEVPESTAPANLARLITIMETPPPWAAGFPLKVEGYISKRYQKL